MMSRALTSRRTSGREKHHDLLLTSAVTFALACPDPPPAGSKLMIICAGVGQGVRVHRGCAAGRGPLGPGARALQPGREPLRVLRHLLGHAAGAVRLRRGAATGARLPGGGAPELLLRAAAAGGGEGALRANVGFQDCELASSPWAGPRAQKPICMCGHWEAGRGRNRTRALEMNECDRSSSLGSARFSTGTGAPGAG